MPIFRNLQYSANVLVMQPVITKIMLLILCCLVLTGNNRCREDYELGARVQTSPSPTPTPTPTPDDDDDEDDEEDDEDDEDEDEDDTTNSLTTLSNMGPTGTMSKIEGASFLDGLRSLESKKSKAKEGSASEKPTSKILVGGNLIDVPEICQSNGNWLGKIYLQDSDAYLDSDGDGLSDECEILLGLDHLHHDTDGDGISDGEELKQGSDPLVKDNF